MGNCSSKANHPSTAPTMDASMGREQNVLPNAGSDRNGPMGAGNPHAPTWGGSQNGYSAAQPNNYMIMPMQMHSPLMGAASPPQMVHNPMYQMPEIPMPPPVESFSAAAPISMGSAQIPLGSAPVMGSPMESFPSQNALMNEAPVHAPLDVQRSVSYDGLHPYYQDRNSTVHYPDSEIPVTHTELAPGVYKELATGEIIWDNEYYGNVEDFLHLLQNEDQFALTRGRMGRRMSVDELANVPAKAASVASIPKSVGQVSASRWPAPPPRPRQEPEAPVPQAVGGQEDVDQTTTDDEHLKEKPEAAPFSEEDTTDYETADEQRRRSEPSKKRRRRRRSRRKASTPWRGIFSRGRK